MQAGRQIVFTILLGSFSALAALAEPMADCERRFAEKPQAEFACGCFYSLGSRQPELADPVYRRVLTLLDQDPGNACLLFSLGRLERLRGEGDAEGHLQAAANVYAQRGLPEGEFYSRLNLVDLLVQRGDPSAAHLQLELAAAAARSTNKTYLVAEVQVRQARLALRLGEPLEKVEALLREATGLAASAHTSLRRDALQSLGEVLHQLGRHDEAEATWRRMIEVTRQPLPDGRSDLYGEAAARQNLAAAYLARPPSPAVLQGAVERFEQALAVALAGRHPAAECDSRRWLGRLRGGAEGRHQIELSIQRARELGDPFLLRLGLAALAAELVAVPPGSASPGPSTGERDLARDLLAEGRRLELQESSPDLRLYGWFDRLAASWALADPDTAIGHALEELAAIEAWRETQENSLTRAEAFSVWADAYSWLAGRLLVAARQDPRHLDQAFTLLERRHARVLLESAGLRPSSPPGDDGFARLAAVQAALGLDEALLYFQQAYQLDIFGDFAGGSWLLVLTRNESRVYPTADPLDLAPAIPLFLDALQNPEKDAATALAPLAARLGQALFGPALDELPSTVKRLVLVPDGQLELLPFAALRLEENAPWLAESYEISMAASATLWLSRRASPTPPPEANVLAIADPTLRPDLQLPPLPGARREAREVLRHMASGSVGWLGAEATEVAFKKADFQPYGVLHLAAHGRHDPALPRAERSAIVLAAGAADDGLLQADEIRRLKLENQLVVLSACRSADGEVVDGEGATSLAQAFYAAGAATLIANLWQLEDEAARTFFGRFYRHLAAGESAGSSLAAAQRESLKAGVPAAVWAGMMLLGDADFRVVPPPPSRLGTGWIAALLTAATLPLLTLLTTRLRKKKSSP